MIEVSYRRMRDYCHCCDRDLDEPVFGEFETYELTDARISNYVDWLDYMEFEEDMPGIVEELLSDYLEDVKCGTELIRVSDGEVRKVAEYIKKKCREGVFK